MGEPSGSALDRQDEPCSRAQQSGRATAKGRSLRARLGRNSHSVLTVGLQYRSKSCQTRKPWSPAKRDLPAATVNPTAPVEWRDVEPTPTGAIIVDEMNGRMSAYQDNRLNLVPVGDVSAGRTPAFEPDRTGERRLLGYWNLTLRSLRPGIAESPGDRAPLSRIRQALTMVIACENESADRVTAGGTPAMPLTASRRRTWRHSSGARRHGTHSNSHRPLRRKCRAAR